MKKLITIILSLIMMFFSAPQKGADQPHVTAVETLQTAIVTQVEQVPEESETTAETAFVGEMAEAETTTEAPKKEVPVVQENVTEECTEVTEEIIAERKKTPSNVLTRAIKALGNTNHKSVVSQIHSRMIYQPELMTDR